jgi:hypothetical protein
MQNVLFPSSEATACSCLAREQGELTIEQRKIRSAANAIAAFIFHLPRINNHCSRAIHFADLAPLRETSTRRFAR